MHYHIRLDIEVNEHEGDRMPDVVVGRPLTSTARNMSGRVDPVKVIRESSESNVVAQDEVHVQQRADRLAVVTRRRALDQAEDDLPTGVGSPEYAWMRQRLASWGMAERDVEKLLKQHSVPKVARAVQWVIAKQASQGVSAPGRLLLSFIGRAR